MKLSGSLMAVLLVVGGLACDQNQSSTTTQTNTKTSAKGKTTEIKTKSEITSGSGKTTETKTIVTKTTTDTKTPDPKTALGIAECDDYLVKMRECTTKMSPSAAASTTDSLTALMKGWKDGASTPQGRAAVTSACEKARDTAKREYVSLGCTF